MSDMRIPSGSRIPAQTTASDASPAVQTNAVQDPRAPADDKVAGQGYTWFDTPWEALESVPKGTNGEPQLVTTECVDGKTRYRPYDAPKDDLRRMGKPLLAVIGTGVVAGGATATAAFSSGSLLLAATATAALSISGIGLIGATATLAYLGVRSLRAGKPGD